MQRVSENTLVTSTFAIRIARAHCTTVYHNGTYKITRKMDWDMHERCLHHLMGGRGKLLALQKWKWSASPFPLVQSRSNIASVAKLHLKYIEILRE